MTPNNAIATALARVRAPLFLVQETERRGAPVLRLHTTERPAAGRLRREAAAELARDGIAADCEVIVHRAWALRRKRSIESLSRSFGTCGVVFDPTGIVSRSESVLACAAMLRAHTTSRVSGIYLSTWRRTLFVVLDKSSFPTDSKGLLAKRVDALREVTGAIGAWRAERCPDFDLAIRIGFELPAGLDLIPVDRRSASRSLRRRLSPAGKRPGLIAALASMLGIGAAAQAGAADISIAPTDPYGAPVSSSDAAVMAPNLGVSLIGGWIDGNGFDSEGFGAATLKAAIPLTHSFGAQIDAAVATEEYYGVAGHIFWRDPNLGLVGVFAAHESFDGSDLNRYGVEADAYMGNLTLSGVVGGQDGAAATGDLFGSADVTFYATPNLALSAGGEFSEDFSFGRVGVEWQPPLDAIPGMSVFADGEFGENDYARAMAGVNFHFGTGGASLIDRDRRFDPTRKVLSAGYGYGSGS